MRFSPLSFLIGVGAAWAFPVVAKSFRALAVEATVTGLALMDEAKRMLAEQREHLEDIAAEARARHEERQAAELADAAAEVADVADLPDAAAAESDAEQNGGAEAGRRRRRRAPASSR